MFDNIENVLCAELEEMDERYKDGHEINSGDLAKADLIFHALKSAATYKAMKEGGYPDDGTSERSYARGRSRTTGRYISRDGMRSGYDPRQVDPYWDRRY